MGKRSEFQWSFQKIHIKDNPFLGKKSEILTSVGVIRNPVSVFFIEVFPFREIWVV